MHRRTVSSMLIVTVTCASLASPAHAGAIGTETALATDRQVILLALERPEVRAALEARGVDPEAAKARVAALSDAEAAQLAAQIDDAPAGGNLGNVLLLPIYMAMIAAKGIALAVKLVAVLVTLPFSAVAGAIK
jgi:hypothetical protein